MRALRIAGMVVAAPVAVLGFMLPADGLFAVVGAVVSAAGHRHGLVIVW